MEGPPVSVIVASRGRPGALALSLTALGQLQYHPFEVIVVADRDGCAVAQAHPLGDRLKIVSFDEANLARARNLGIAEAAGEFVAFIDDDAFAEPGWLYHLVSVFSDARIAGSGGYVIGRNGISLQWRARAVDLRGWHCDVPLADDSPLLPELDEGFAARTEGTNMAFRRARLVELGGFDETYRYFLEDTDLNLRMAKAGLPVVFVPRARVWHRQDASPERHKDRAPRDLTEIGASTAAFLSRHADQGAVDDALAAHRADQHRRLVRHMIRGALLPGDVLRLLSSFDTGAAGGRHRVPMWVDIRGPKEGFRALHHTAVTRDVRFLAGWAWERRSLDAKARKAVAEGALVHMLRLTPTALYHRLRYVEPGVWVQTGGLFGRSVRNAPLVRAFGHNHRAKQEFAAGPLSRIVSFSRGSW